ncbi:MAG: hypothetical protein LUF32_08160 [Clostridiales bacterium]|nr:hypothetical protein [Clostridiales bacterium]
MNIAYNLSDIALYYNGGPDYTQHLKDTGCSRFYFGSYFCGKYCMRSMNFFMQSLSGFFRENSLSVSLVIPPAPGPENEMLKQGIQSFFAYCGDCADELVVNDYATLQLGRQLQSWYRFRLTAGRLFSKNFRDPRYPEFEQETSTAFFPEMLRGEVSAIEVDLTAAHLDFSEIDEDVQIHAHYPYVYVTGGQNCQFAAAAHPAGEQFIGRPGCHLSCMNGYMETTAENAVFLHLGKGLYTKHDGPTSWSRTPDRFLYWPADEFLKNSQEETSGGIE